MQTKKKLIADGNPPDTVMIGCSAWARDAGAFQKDADDLVVELTKVHFLYHFCAYRRIVALSYSTVH